MEYIELLTKLKPFLTDKQYHIYHRLYLASEAKPRLRRNVELVLQAPRDRETAVVGRRSSRVGKGHAA